jgi:triosephosphate isomerase
MLKDCGAHFVEIGHSERRTHFGETDDTVGRKTLNALHHGLTPLICIGETRKEREEGRACQVLSHQVNGALQFIKDTKAKVIFAYEPVWSIGECGSPASPEYADQMHAEIKATASKCLRAKTNVLYGGSVNSGNCEELISREHIDGLFIGRAAWNVENYIDILTRCSRIFD